jgi:small-conductance mechanosensitive channel
MPAWTEPRTAPPTLLPAIAGVFVIALALPVFLIAGWRVSGWALGAVLWAGSEAFGALLSRLQTRTGNLAAAGVVAFGMLFRAIAVMVVVFAVAVSDKWLGLAAALTYAAGYSANLGLQLVAYYTGPKAGAVH